MKFLESLGQLSTQKMTLNNPNTVSSEDGTSGTWTMIYDEGFEVAKGDLVYFAFSKFTFTDLEMKQNVSHCDQTHIGWYHDKARSKWGCYVGKKVTADAAPVQSKPAIKQPVAALQQPVAALQSFGSALNDDEDEEPRKLRSREILTSWLDAKDPMSLEPDDRKEPVAMVEEQGQESDSSIFSEPPQYKAWVPNSAGFDKPMEGPWQQSVAAALNFLQLGWTAHAYDKFQGKTPHELNTYAGVRRIVARAKKDAKREEFTSFLGMSRKVHHVPGEADAFDWRKKDGKNWLEPVVTQGDCGSCYTVSTVHMLTARNKIKSGSIAEPSFSVSFPLYCSEYNQGCDGGYGFLQSKWTEDVGLVPESCAPFSQGGDSCKITPNCKLGDKRYRGTNHHYVGGYYGGSDEPSIKQELVQHGPVVMSFEPKEDFMYYKDGVYKSSPEKIHQEWEQVDHAVLLVGYGVDNVPYWTMQNSWGDDWGEDGYFRMARGSDESGCESIVVSADVVQETSNPILDDFLASL